MEYKRLTNRLKNGAVRYNNGHYECTIYPQNKYMYDETKQMVLRLADLEDMIENGQIRILPCKLGDHIYVITRHGNFIDLDEYVVDWFDTYNIDDKNIGFYFNGKDVEDDHLEFCCYDTDFGETVFLTKPEAEAKLEELKKQIK